MRRGTSRNSTRSGVFIPGLPAPRRGTPDIRGRSTSSGRSGQGCGVWGLVPQFQVACVAQTPSPCRSTGTHVHGSHRVHPVGSNRPLEKYARSYKPTWNTSGPGNGSNYSYLRVWSKFHVCSLCSWLLLNCFKMFLSLLWEGPLTCP